MEKLLNRDFWRDIKPLKRVKIKHRSSQSSHSDATIGWRPISIEVF